MKYTSLLLLLVILLLLLAGCSPQAASQPTATPVTGPASTATTRPRPTSTDLPTATQPSTATAAPSRTATASPTPPSEMADATLFTSGFLDRWRYFIALQAAEPIEGTYYMVVDENKEYTCSIESNHLDRLYCVGRLAGVNKAIPYELYDNETGTLVNQGEVRIPINVP